MPPEYKSALGLARSASAEELKLLVREGSEEMLLAMLENPNIKELHMTMLLDRLDLPANVLSAVAAQSKWMSMQEVRLRVASHPCTPKRIALASVRQLYLFELVRVSLLPSAPADIKRIAEESIIARIPQLPVGQKLTLARRGPSRVAGAMLAEGHAQAVKLALNNAFLAESQILKVLANPRVPDRVVVAISQHPRWASQYNVRMALVRNRHIPAPSVLAFLPHLTMRDLQEIVASQDLAPHLKEYIERELRSRELP
jgi:hypothetical protein